MTDKQRDDRGQKIHQAFSAARRALRRQMKGMLCAVLAALMVLQPCTALAGDLENILLGAWGGSSWSRSIAERAQLSFLGGGDPFGGIFTGPGGYLALPGGLGSSLWSMPTRLQLATNYYSGFAPTSLRFGEQQLRLAEDNLFGFAIRNNFGGMGDIFRILNTPLGGFFGSGLFLMRTGTEAQLETAQTEFNATQPEEPVAEEERTVDNGKVENSDGGDATSEDLQKAAADSSYALSANSAFLARYNALTQRAARAQFTNSTLAALRTEYARNMLRLANDDAYLVYWSYYRNAVLNQVYQACNSYQPARQLSQEISGWTVPPSSAATLNQRYQKRLQLATLLTQLQQESLAFIAARPQWAQWLTQATTNINSRQQVLQAQKVIANGMTVAAYQQDWTRRYQAAAFASAEFANLSREFQQLLNDYPDFAEYLRVGRDLYAVIGAMQTSVANSSQARAIQAYAADISRDANVANEFRYYYSQYLSQTGWLINSTNYAAELERFYEKQNGLLQGDSSFRNLTAAGQDYANRLNTFQQQVAQAVDRAYANGNWSNPYGDRTVTALYNASYQSLLGNAAAITDSGQRYAALFQTGTAYASLSNEAEVRLRNTLNPIAAQLQAASDQFTRNVRGIYKLALLANAMAQFENTVRNSNPQLNYLLTRLDQLAERVRQLTAS